MNPQAFDSTDDLRQLDRLVDGELTEPERRELFAQIDRQADGWRRLALAFLEAQSWGEAARAEVANAFPAHANTIQPTSASGVAQRNWNLWLGTPLAMAASFLVAFTLGIALRGAWRGSDPVAPLLAAGQNARAEQAARAAIAQAQSRSAADADEAPVLPGSVAANELTSDDIEEVWLPSDEGGSAESSLAGTPPPAVPDHVLQSLRRLGHEVETRRSLWPIDLQNGQRALVPVDEVEIRYVGNHYQ